MSFCWSFHRGLATHTLFSCNGASTNDSPSSALFDHLLSRMLIAEVNPFPVNVKRLIPVLRRSCQTLLRIIVLAKSRSSDGALSKKGLGMQIPAFATIWRMLLVSSHRIRYCKRAYYVQSTKSLFYLFNHTYDFILLGNVSDILDNLSP